MAVCESCVFECVCARALFLGMLLAEGKKRAPEHDTGVKQGSHIVEDSLHNVEPARAQAVVDGDNKIVEEGKVVGHNVPKVDAGGIVPDEEDKDRE